MRETLSESNSGVPSSEAVSDNSTWALASALQKIERFAKGRAGRVLAQTPVAGVAAAPHLKVRLLVGRG